MKTPRPGRWLLTLTMSKTDSVARSIVGDLEEEYTLRRDRDGPVHAWIWFNRQAAGVAWHEIQGDARNGGSIMGGGMIQDLRFAVRALRAHPAVNAMVVGIVAVGVAGTALAFSLVDQALLQSLPFRSPQELYEFRHLSPEAGADLGQVSPMDVADLRHGLGWENTLTSYAFDPSSSVMTLTGEGLPEPVQHALVDGAFFDVLGVAAAAGRTLHRADNVPGRDRVVVLSHDFWTQRFGADPRMVGRTLRLDGAVFEVVGILPPSFAFPSQQVRVWLPASLLTEDQVPNRRDVRYRRALLRVPAPSDAGEARLAAEGVFARLADAYPETNEGWTRAELIPLRDAVIAGYRTGILFLMGVTALLLLVVATSVGGLLTARTAGRRRELAIRLSVGADRKRLARQLLGESVILGTMGGLVGLGAAWTISGVASRFTSEALGFAANVQPDLRVASFTALVSLVTGLAFGIIPSWSVLRAPPHVFLGGARGGRQGVSRGLKALVLGETALAAILLAGTGLMVRSFQSLVETDPGFDTEDVWSLRFQINIPGGADQLIVDRQRLVDIASAVPGVVSVGGSKTPLLEGGGEAYLFTTIDPAGGEIEVRPESGTYLVLPGFFETLGTRFVAGRAFTHDDSRQSVVVNSTLAESLWPGENATDRHLKLGSLVLPVLGVIEPLHDDGLAAGTQTAIYVNAVNFPRTSFFMFVRTVPGASDVIPAVRQAIWREYPDQAILETTRVGDILDGAIARPRWLARVIGGFGLLALLLAALGVYGVVAQGVQTRRGDIAVRIALGARPEWVLREQLSGGMWIIAIGTVVGLSTALGLARMISSLLFGIEAYDVVAFGSAGVAVLLVGFVATLIPALRATRIDPVHIIREE